MTQQTAAQARAAYNDRVRNLNMEICARIENDTLTEEDLKSSLICAARNAWHAYLHITRGAICGNNGSLIHHRV